jgi:hypothetical protein
MAVWPRMKSIVNSITLILLAGSAWAGPTVKDLAISEARKCDLDYNGRIEGTEVSMLRSSFAKNPKSWLYLYDDNGNRILEDNEISKIKFTPKPKPVPKKPGAGKPALPKKPAPPKKK